MEKKSVKVHERIDDIQEISEYNTGEILEFKEISHMIDDAVQIILNKIDTLEKRIEKLEEDYFHRGMTRLEKRIARIIRQQVTDWRNVPEEPPTSGGDPRPYLLEDSATQDSHEDTEEAP